MVTGGLDGSMRKTVAQYTVTGDVTYLAELQTGRYGHACSKFLDGDGQLVSISNRELGPFYTNQFVDIFSILFVLDSSGNWRK